MEKIPIQKIVEQHEVLPKGIAFVFSRGVECDGNGEITGLDHAVKQRLHKAIELYNEGKIAYFIVCGGMFETGLHVPMANMMKDYLIEHGISDAVIVTERHSKDTNTNVLFGHHLIHLISTRENKPISEFADLPIYYISGEEHLERIRTIVEGQREKIKFSRGAPRKKSNISTRYAFISSGTEEDGSLLARVKNRFGERVHKYDPYGQGPLSKYIRGQRTYKI